MRQVFALGVAGMVMAGSIGPVASAQMTPAVRELEIVASKFAFDPSVIQVTPGEPIRLVLRSADVVHGFAIHDLKIDVQIPRGGAAVTIEFTAPPPGRYEIACSEFCGRGHGQMKAMLVSATATEARR
jgi:cytochrome c oxidase subunit 2